jgi:serine/threonine-protein kinase
MTSVAVPRFEPQSRIGGKYRLTQRIAVGGMGEVWAAFNESTHADVALKVLRRGDADMAKELQIEQRFRHEARLSAMLSHRSIVKVYDMLEEPDGTLVLVMELLRGESLRRYLRKRGPLEAKEAVAIMSPVLSALGHAHQRGIVHRDVTPSNIFLAVDPDGHMTPKLVDFGIAKLANGGSPVKTEDGRLLGTPRYSAPERIRCASEVDGRADVFSAAVVLYEMMTGVCPFGAGNSTGELVAVLERHVDPDERIDPRLWVEIQRAMSKQPYERHATAHELGAALRAAIGETEGSLQRLLKEAAQLPGWEPPPATLPSDRPWAMEANDHSFSVAVSSKRKPSPALLFAAKALVAVGLIVAGLVGARPRTQTSSTPTESVALSLPPVPMTSSSSPTPDPTAIAIAMAIPTTTATAKPIPTHKAPPRLRLRLRPRPRPAPHPRPVATTPGF